MSTLNIRKANLPMDEKQDPGGTADSYTLVLINWRTGAWQPTMTPIPGFKSWGAANIQGIAWRNTAISNNQENHDYHIVAVS